MLEQGKQRWNKMKSQIFSEWGKKYERGGGLDVYPWRALYVRGSAIALWYCPIHKYLPTKKYLFNKLWSIFRL